MLPPVARPSTLILYREQSALRVRVGILFRTARRWMIADINHREAIRRPPSNQEVFLNLLFRVAEVDTNLPEIGRLSAMQCRMNELASLMLGPMPPLHFRPGAWLGPTGDLRPRTKKPLLDEIMRPKSNRIDACDLVLIH